MSSHGMICAKEHGRHLKYAESGKAITRVTIQLSCHRNTRNHAESSQFLQLQRALVLFFVFFCVIQWQKIAEQLLTRKLFQGQLQIWALCSREFCGICGTAKP